ncbi:MAG: valine--tRNA ligase [Patescibacteria group bacterium]
MKEIAKAYDHNQVETELYKMWEESGYFKPEVNPDGEPYSIIMPPPNANGSLHLGHAVFITIEDLMIRFARLSGKAALWLPGADHAGFETQVVFEKKLEKEGKSRFDMSREELYKATLEFTLKNKEVMESQLKRLGASCDWERGKFTLDPDIIATVYQTFVDLYNDGLAYRASRPVNWCTKHQTSLSDLEVKYEEQVDPLYYIKYGPLVLATVRPETKFGDTAVAVNPSDARYKEYVGKEIEIETVLGKAKIKVVADDYVDPKFGTGAVKITPAHDPNDFEVAKRHNLEIREVIDQYGRLNEKAGPYKGMKVKEARLKVAEDMQAKGLIEKIDENYTHTVGKCYKCGTVIEPRVLPQWFIAVNEKGKKSGKTLAKDALDAVDTGKTKFVTEKFEKIYRHWMTNIRDWNVSRQIVWGIQLPVWYCKCGETIVTNGETPERCPECGSTKLDRDPDVFDTWFSSGQWPFATLLSQSGESKVESRKSKDFDKFYSTTVMETGWDILFFWVARMMMLGLYVTDKVPFENVYLHGLVRDKDRQKMSKSKGNVIDPLGVADLYGSDAVRMALVFGTSAGNDAVISEEKIRGMRNFSNKIWNASRFTILRVTGGDVQTGEIGEETIGDLEIDNSILTDADKAILKKHAETIKSVTKNIEKYNFSFAAEEIYAYFWHDFCDVYIEATKAQLDDSKIGNNTKKILIKIIVESLQMLHPFMPFVTEAVWQELRKISPRLKDSIMISKWPR